MPLTHCAYYPLFSTASGFRLRLSESRSALTLLLIFSFFLPLCVSAQSDKVIPIADDTLGVKVYFRQSYSTLQPSFRQNGIRLDEFVHRVSGMHCDSSIRLNAIDIVAYSSPEGSYTLNKKLAGKRAANISAYLHDKMPFLPDTLYNVQPQGIDWNGLAAMVEASDMRYRTEVLDILRNVPETTYSNGKLVDSRVKRLMDLRGGRPYNYMLEHFFPEMRSAGAYVVCDFERIATVVVPDTVAAVEKNSEPGVEPVEPVYIEETATEEVAEVPRDTSLPALGSNLSALKDYDCWAIKSNALYLAAGVTNIGGEYAFHPHWSVDLPLVYSPYTIARTYRMRFLYIQPEARFWLDCPMKGHFFGMHLHAGVFNVSFDTDNRYQSEKGFYGAGISYGCAMPLSRRWSMDFTVGVGYAFTRYCTYYNVHNGIRYEKDIPYNYWGLTKLGLNFVYRFGDKCGKHKKIKDGKEVQP